MRLIGEMVDQKSAERFADYLAARGIDSEIREDDGRQHLWALDEDRLGEACELYDAYRANPDDARFDAPPRRPKRPPAPEFPAAGTGRARYVDVRSQMTWRPSVGNVTVALIAVAVVLTGLSSLPGATSFVRMLYYSEYHGREFPEILAGQVWRVFTPIFLHGGVLHLVFNMIWLYQLGGAIEANEGRRYFLVQTLTFAACVNTAQYVVSGPLFVGMSGVVYALLGYTWMMSKYDAKGRYALAPQTVGFMVVWMALCIIGIIPNVANTQHVAGFVVGTAWGFLRSGRLGAIRRRRRYQKSL